MSDRKNLMILYGKKKGKLFISILTIIGYLLVPLMLNKYILFIPSIIAGLISFHLINKRIYNEKPIILIYILYLIVIGFILVYI